MTALDSRLILPATIDRFTRAFVVRHRRLILLRTFGGLVAGCCAWSVAWALADRFFQLPSWLRAGVLGVNAIVFVVGVAVALWRARSRAFAWQDAAAAIELRDPALADRLQTVITQVSMPGGVRGSDALLADLAGEVTSRLDHQSPGALLPGRAVLPATVSAGAVLVIVAVLATIPFLNLRQLLARQFRPYAEIPPVTTTRLLVTPGDIDVAQGSNVTVTAHVARLGKGDVRLWTGVDEQRLGAQVMPRDLAGDFVVALKNVDRDTAYRVSGGDATSELFLVRVLRKPAMRELRVRYTYPAYLDRGPLAQVIADGRLEAPKGTWAEVSVVATEPLKAADLIVDRGADDTHGVERVATYATSDPAVRTAWLELTRTAPLRLELVSDRNVIGTGPDGMRVTAIEDRPPLVQLMREDLRLAPSDVLALPYQAIDDYGVVGLRARVSSAAKTLFDAPLAIPSDPRLVRDVMTLDLAPYALAFGDVVSVTVTAVDGAGQSRTSTPCSVLIAPRSVEPKTLQRIAALREAATAAKDLLKSPDNATDVQKALLRASSRADSPAAADHAARLIDAAQRLISDRGWVFSDKPLEGVQREIAERLTRDVAEFYQGEQAKTLLAELENINAGEQRQGDASKPEAEALKKSVQRARAEWEATVKELGLDPRAGDTPARLEALTRALEGRLADRSTLDAPQVAREWAERPPDEARTARDRLAVAAQAEVLRPDGELSWARDLQLASRAIDELDDAAPTNRDARNGVADALGTLRDTRRETKNPDVPVEHRRELDARAEAARERLRGLAGEQPALATENAADEPGDAKPDSSALDTSTSQQKTSTAPPDFWKPRPTPDPAAAARRSADTAQRLVEVTRRQQRLLDRTRALNAPEQASKLAQDQQRLADAIGGVRQEDAEGIFDGATRDDSTSAALDALRASQQALAALPQRIAELRRLAAQARAWEEKRAAAQAAAGVATEGERTAADRAAAEATRQADDARARLAEAAGPALASAAESVRDAMARARQSADAPSSAAAASDSSKSDAGKSDPSKSQSPNNGAASANHSTQAESPANSAAAPAAALGNRAVAAQQGGSPSVERSAGAERNAIQPPVSKGAAAPFGPTLDSAAGSGLAPALTELQRSLAEGDSATAEASAGAALRAIAQSQASLRAAQRQVAQRDPLVAARFFARQASLALEQRPPDFEAASAYQRETNTALSSAWDTALDRGLRARLESVPGLRALLSEDYGRDASDATAVDAAAPGDRSWGRLAARAPGDVAATAGDVEPAGFEEALRLYFKTLDAARSTEGKR